EAGPGHRLVAADEADRERQTSAKSADEQTEEDGEQELATAVRIHEPEHETPRVGDWKTDDDCLERSINFKRACISVAGRRFSHSKTGATPAGFIPFPRHGASFAVKTKHDQPRHRSANTSPICR